MAGTEMFMPMWSAQLRMKTWLRMDTLVLAESEPGMYLFIFQNPTSSPYLRWCPHGWFQVFNWKFGCIRAYVTSWFSMLPPKITFYSIFDGSVECTSHARFRFHCNRNRTSVIPSFRVGGGAAAMSRLLFDLGVVQGEWGTKGGLSGVDFQVVKLSSCHAVKFDPWNLEHAEKLIPWH